MKRIQTTVNKSCLKLKQPISMEKFRVDQSAASTRFEFRLGQSERRRSLDLNNVAMTTRVGVNFAILLSENCQSEWMF